MGVLFRRGSLNVPEFPPLKSPGSAICWQERKEICARHPAQSCWPRTYVFFAQSSEGKTVCEISDQRLHIIHNYCAPTWDCLRSRYSSCQLMYLKKKVIFANSFLIFSQDARVAKKQELICLHPVISFHRNGWISCENMPPLWPSLLELHQPGKISSVSNHR